MGSNIHYIKNKLTDDPRTNIIIILESLLDELNGKMAIYDVPDTGLNVVVVSNDKGYEVFTGKLNGDLFYRNDFGDEGKPLVYSNLEDTDECKNSDFVNDHQLKSCMAIPIYDSGELVSSIAFFDTEEREFTEDNIKVLNDSALMLMYEGRHITSCDSLNNTYQKFVAIFDNSTDGIILLRDELIIDYNKSITKLLNIDKDHLIGKKLGDIINRREKEENISVVIKKVKSEDSVVVERELTRDADIHFEAELSFSNIKDLDDCNILVILRDITKRKAYERGLIAATEKAEESSRLKSVSLASMSHELRTPLNSIIGFSELLLDEDTTESEKEMFSKLIRTAGKSLMALIGDIIDISKIEAGQVTIKKSFFNINSFLQDILLMFKQEKENLDKSNIEMRLILSDKASDLKIESDQHRLQQVFSNLLTNSLKFIDEGYIEFGYLSITPKFIQFYVKDTGVGIEKTKREKIFEVYGQDNITYNRNKEGTGLGLAISKSFVELLGGSIWVDSELDAGSTFYFTIPVKLDVDYTNKFFDKAIKTGGRWNGKTILIADDVKENYIFLNGILKDTGAKIHWAKDGEEAVVICRQEKVDLILLDIRMPVMDGYEAARIIQDESPKTILIAQTAFANPEDRKFCLENGFDEYLKKPIDYENLISVITKYLD